MTGEDTAPAWGPDLADLTAWGVSQAEARDMLRRQVCPVCSEGPWRSPLIHASKRHGIDHFTMRELCGITTVESVVAPELAERLAENGKGRDMSTVGRSTRRKYRTTAAGRAAVTANISAVNADPAAQSRALAAAASGRTPEARAKQGESLRQRYAAMSAEERAERSKHLRRAPEALAQQAREMWDAKGRQPCGTRAAYRRGCRCDECVTANRLYKRRQYEAAKPR